MDERDSGTESGPRPSVHTNVGDEGRRVRKVLGEPTVNELVADYLAQDPVRFIVAFGKVREGVLPVQDYFPFFRYFSNSSKGRQLITLPFSTQARLAWEMPYFMKPRARSSWASVSMVMLTPAPIASRM